LYTPQHLVHRESTEQTASTTVEALGAVLRAPSVKLALVLAALVAVPVFVSVEILKPVFNHLFDANSTATIIRRALQVALMAVCLFLAIRSFRNDKRIHRAALTRVLVGAALILFLPEVALRALVTPLLARILPGTELPVAVGELAFIPGLLLLYSALFSAYERRQIGELSRSGFWTESALGFVCGISIPSLTYLFLFLSGHYSVVSVNSVTILVYGAIAMAFVSCLEELFFRGVVYRISESELGTHLAIVLSAAVFGFAHLANENMCIAGLLSASMGGALLGILFSLTGRLWIPISFHFGWNVSQIFFGSNVSGVSRYGSFLEGRLEGPVTLTGGAFGIETSLPLLICLTVLTVFLYSRLAMTGRVAEPFWTKQIEAPLPLTARGLRLALPESWAVIAHHPVPNGGLRCLARKTPSL